MRTLPLVLIVCLFVVAGFSLTQLATEQNRQQEPENAALQKTPTQATQTPGARCAVVLEDLLASTTETQYQHSTEIDEANGIVKCDCSGLIGYTLRHHFPKSYLALHGEEAAWRKRPLAVTFYETFQAAPTESDRAPWVQVKRIVDVLPGDMIAWRKKKIVRGKSTGHVLMVAGSPEVLQNGQVRIRTLESTSVSNKSGFQAKTRTFTSDQAGYPTGYLSGEKRLKAIIAIGRLNDPIQDTGTSDRNARKRF